MNPTENMTNYTLDNYSEFDISNATMAPMCGEDTVLKTAIKLLAYSAVLLVSLVGNIRVILLILRSPLLRRRTINLLVVNMALSDLFLSLFAIPRTMTETVTEPARWLVDGNFGEALCKLDIFIQDVSTAVSIESLVLIAFDRFCAVIYPIRTATRPRFRILCIPLTWVVACAIHSPTFFIYSLERFDGFLYCEHKWSLDRDEHFRIARNHYLVMFSLFVGIPFVLLTVLYSAILLKLRQRGYLVRTPRRLSSRRRREYNVLKMAVAILIAFAVCWAPFNIFVFLIVFVWDFSLECASQNASWFFSVFLAYANSAVNPAIYHFFSKNFRKVSKRNYLRQRGRSPYANVPMCCRERLELIRTRKRKSSANTPKLELITAL